MADIYAGLDTDDLVTGEAVTLELPPASLGTRLLSGLIDVTLEAGLLLVGFIAVGMLATDEALYAVGSIVVFAGALVVVPCTLETFTRGKSVGKYAIGTRTVRDDAGPISFHHAFIRALVGVVEIWMFWGVPALVTSLVNSRGKRLGDLVAGTYVVRDKIGLLAARTGADAPTARALGPCRRHRAAARGPRDLDPAAARAGHRPESRRLAVPGGRPRRPHAVVRRAATAAGHATGAVPRRRRRGAPRA